MDSTGSKANLRRRPLCLWIVAASSVIAESRSERGRNTSIKGNRKETESQSKRVREATGELQYRKLDLATPDETQ